MPFDPSHRPLISFLEKTRGKRVYALMNVGNRGDGLIHKGWRTLCEKLGLDIPEIQFPSHASGDLLLIHGAGALGQTYISALKELTFYRPHFREFAVLPATIDPENRAVHRWLQELDPSWTIFLREAESLRRVREANPRFDRFHLDEDLAFHCDLSAWAARPHTGTARCFRQDHESGGFASDVGGPNVDISQGLHGDVDVLLDFVAAKSCIHTDRTHVAIAAALMGREVRFFPNSYFKNRAIYEHSLARFPNVTFHPRPSNRAAQLWRKSLNRLKTAPSRLRYWLWVTRRDRRARSAPPWP